MHKKYAFHFQCFRSDPFTCKTKAERLIDGWFDEKNVAYKTHVKVPRHIPNGIYVYVFFMASLFTLLMVLCNDAQLLPRLVAAICGVWVAEPGAFVGLVLWVPSIECLC